MDNEADRAFDKLLLLRKPCLIGVLQAVEETVEFTPVLLFLLWTLDILFDLVDSPSPEFTNLFPFAVQYITIFECAGDRISDFRPASGELLA